MASLFDGAPDYEGERVARMSAALHARLGDQLHPEFLAGLAAALACRDAVLPCGFRGTMTEAEARAALDAAAIARKQGVA